MEKDWLTVEQAKQCYGIARQAIVRAAERGEIKARIYQGPKRTHIRVFEPSLRRWARHYGLGKYDLSKTEARRILGYGPLSVQQAAKLCGISAIRIYRLLYEGKLRAKRTPWGHWRIDPWSLRDWALASGLPINENLRFVSTDRQMKLVREFVGVAAKAHLYAQKHNITLPDGWTNILLQQIHNREKERHLDLRKLTEDRG